MEDLTGRVFERLTVRSWSGRTDNQGRRIWLCDCACGNTDVPVIEQSLTTHDTRSCGCLKTEAKARFSRVHGFFGRPVSLVRIAKICIVCKKEFEVLFDENEAFYRKSAERRKVCDTCKVKKNLGVR